MVLVVECKGVGLLVELNFPQLVTDFRYIIQFAVTVVISQYIASQQCGEKEKDNPDVARVRKVIDTKCNDRQQKLFYAHFGEGKQLEEIRKEEVAATGKEKKLQAILNVKNDIIRKVADEYGVVPVKRRKRGKSK